MPWCPPEVLVSAGLPGLARAFPGRPSLPLAYWVDDLSPFLVHFHGNFGIRYYGMAYMLGFLAAVWLLHVYAKAGRSLLPSQKIPDFMAAVVLGVLLGGRLGYFLFYEPAMALADPLAIFRIWEGGMSSHGGMIGVAVALAWYSRSQKIRLAHVCDLVASAAPAGLFFGRIANFINGELWGKRTSLPWAVIFPRSGEPGAPIGLIAPRHPSQLYEAFFEGLLLFMFMQIRFWRGGIVRTQPGRLSGEFLVAYALARTVGELFREPDAPLILGLSRGTFYSLFMLAAGAAVWVFPKKPLDAPP
jgi:phosphatidylglycerol:prolipoprotein diacylglycerol transferase